MSRERPILFSADMVRALLDGRKTQTRRVIKNADKWSPHGPEFFTEPGPALDALVRHHCPYGKPGDRLWVKEPYIIYQTIDHIVRPDGRAFSEVSDGLAAYLADGYQSVQDLREHVQMISECEEVITDGDLFKRPECMPRWASRITLDITAIRVERLQDISEADAIAEGIEDIPNPIITTWRDYSIAPEDNEGHNYFTNPIKSFASLIDSIKGPGTWAANPWVWVIEFEAVK